jgi:hypothetical protein
VPSTAVFEHQGASAVWVMVAEGELVKPVLRPVTVRQYREDGVVIASCCGRCRARCLPACGQGAESMRFNLSEWALRNQPLVRYLIIALAIVGVMSFQKLGQSEDPPFTFKVMVVRTDWPGASAREVEQQVTDRIEKKLQETPLPDFLRSFSRPASR